MACIYKFQRIKVSAKALPALVLSAMMSLFFIKVYKRSDKSKQGYWRVENKIKKNNIELYIKLEKDDFKMRNKELNLTQFETLSDEELQKIEGGYLPIPDMPGWREANLLLGGGV